MIPSPMLQMMAAPVLTFDTTNVHPPFKTATYGLNLRDFWWIQYSMTKMNGFYFSPCCKNISPFFAYSTCFWIPIFGGEFQSPMVFHVLFRPVSWDSWLRGPCLMMTFPIYSGARQFNDSHQTPGSSHFEPLYGNWGEGMLSLTLCWKVQFASI